MPLWGANAAPQELRTEGGAHHSIVQCVFMYVYIFVFLSFVFLFILVLTIIFMFIFISCLMIILHLLYSIAPRISPGRIERVVPGVCCWFPGGPWESVGNPGQAGTRNQEERGQEIRVDQN